MAAGVGIEPTNDGIKIRCLTAWRTRNKKGGATTRPHVCTGAFTRNRTENRRLQVYRFTFKL